MNKKQILDSVVSKSGLKQKEAEAAIHALTDTFAEALANGEKPSWPGLGTFKTRKRASRMGRNPQTGETISIPEKENPVFKPSKSFRDRAKLQRN